VKPFWLGLFVGLALASAMGEVLLVEARRESAWPVRSSRQQENCFLDAKYY
jgi:hypothetical protein